MMGASKTHHGLAVLFGLILMFLQFSLVSSVDETGTNQVESSTTGAPAATDSTTTPLPTDLPMMTTTTTTTTTTTSTTTTPPPATIATTISSEPNSPTPTPNSPTPTLDVISTTTVQSTTTDTTTVSEAATTGQPRSTEPTTSAIAPTPTTSPTTTTTSASGSTTLPASSGVTPLPSSPGAEPHSTAESAGSGTIAVSSTTVSTEITVSSEGSGSATSTESGSSVSVLTSTLPSPTVTATATATVTVTAATTAAAATTTTTAKPAYPTKKPEKPFRLDFKVGDSNASTVYCTDNCTFSTIVGGVQTAFGSVPGYLYVERGNGAANRKRRDARVSVSVLFNPRVMVGLTAEDRGAFVYGAFQNLAKSSPVQVQIDQVNDTIVSAFVEDTTDMCKVPNTCPLGYRCSQGVCYHLCETHDCSSNGVCQAVVDTDGSSSATCVCNSGYEHTYSGAHCENEETSDAKKAAIVGGVLGTFCAIFLILIVFLYCRLRESDGGSKRNYQLGGYSNNGYADQEFAMRNPASDDP